MPSLPDSARSGRCHAAYFAKRYDCQVKESRREADSSLRLAAALILSPLDALVCGQFDVARSCAGSRVTAGPFAGHSGNARPLAVIV
jgi:hypothetical protein